MLRLIVLFIFFGFISLTAIAAIVSIGVENLNGKKTIVHKLEPKETYFSLGRKYNVSPQSIIQFNSNKSLQIGAIVKIPTDRPFTDVSISNINSSQQTSQSLTEKDRKSVV